MDDKILKYPTKLFDHIRHFLELEQNLTKSIYDVIMSHFNMSHTCDNPTSNICDCPVRDVTIKK